MLRNCSLLILLISTVSALRCRMCDSYISCANEMSEHCPPHTQCYTIRNQGTVTHKGCATNCAAIPYAISTSHCTTCNHRDNCNDESSSPSIGHGVDPKHHSDYGYHIGDGVRPRSSAPAQSVASLLAASVALVLLQ